MPYNSLAAMDQAPPTLIEEIDAFVARHGMSPITFGRKAMNDPHFVRDVRDGRRLWPETDAKARAFMADFDAGQQQEAA